MYSLHFAWGVAEAKCILCVCLCVFLSFAGFPHYCTDPDVSWWNGRGCPLVVHFWADLQLVHGFRCYDKLQHSAEREMSARACTRWMPGFGLLFVFFHNVWMPTNFSCQWAKYLVITCYLQQQKQQQRQSSLCQLILHSLNLVREELRSFTERIRSIM